MPADSGGVKAAVAAAAGLALADASIVTLALPELLTELETTVIGVSMILIVYTLVLAGALPVAERLRERHGDRQVALWGAALFAVAGGLCGVVSALVPMLVLRALQALGGATLLVCAFAALEGGGRGRRTWTAAAVFATAVGPALGGALTEAFDWRAIFFVQVPVALAAMWAFAQPGQPQHVGPQPPAERPRGPAVALAFLSASLSGVLLMLVLLLVAGWAMRPLEAALTVSVLPLAAFAGSRLGGSDVTRAATGCALVGAGVLALAFLPDDSALWTVPPQIAGGLGMGLALPALAGHLLPERTPREAAWLLSVRHLGIGLGLLIIAPIAWADLDDATIRARERGVALALDAKLPPLQKVRLAPELLASVDAEAPRQALRDALDARRGDFGDPEERAEFDTLARRADETLVTAVGEAFRTAFLLAGLFALLGAAALVPRRRIAGGPAAAAIAVLLLPVAYAVAHDRLEPEPVRLADPCAGRPLPGAGGLTGFFQDRAIEALDATACRLGSTREELVLALADPDDAARFEREHGRNPRDVGTLLDSFLGG